MNHEHPEHEQPPEEPEEPAHERDDDAIIEAWTPDAACPECGFERGHRLSPPCPNA